jgi:hypothetical protein
MKRPMRTTFVSPATNSQRSAWRFAIFRNQTLTAAAFPLELFDVATVLIEKQFAGRVLCSML